MSELGEKLSLSAKNRKPRRRYGQKRRRKMISSIAERYIVAISVVLKNGFVVYHGG